VQACEVIVSDYFLSATTAAVMEAGLAAVGLYGGTNEGGTDFNADFAPAQFGQTGFIFTRGQPDGGTYQLVVLGLLTSPQHQVTIEPVEPGNFTSNVGQPEEPEDTVIPLNPNVGIEQVPNLVQAFWVRLSWNSGVQMPTLPNTITVSTKSPFAGDLGGSYPNA
jgi:hypothetical protein